MSPSDSVAMASEDQAECVPLLTIPRILCPARLWHGVFTPNCCTRLGRRRSTRTKSEPTAVPTPSFIHHHAEAAIDHPLAVEGHGIAVLFQARVFHHLLHADVAHLAGGPLDPGEHHGFLRFQFHRHGEGGEFPVGYIVAPAFGDAQGAVLPESGESRMAIATARLRAMTAEGCWRY